MAVVTGIYDIAYLKDKTGDLGVAGPAVGVVEKNLIDELQESVAKLDFDGMKKKAIDNYWPRQVFQNSRKRQSELPEPSIRRSLSLKTLLHLTAISLQNGGDLTR